MARRTAEEQSGFGSDSFLDIIANIVGILIILIVVAGVRVSQAPLLDADPDAAATPVPAPLVGTSDAPEWEPPPVPTPLPPADPPLPEPVVIDLTEEPDPELFRRHDRQVAQRGELETELKSLVATALRLRNQRTAAEQTLAERQTAETRLDGLLAAARGDYDAARSQVEAQVEQEDSALKSLDRLKSLVTDAERRVAALENREETREVLQHEVTPVSEVVRGKELHFLVHNNRVSEVPLEELMERIKEEIEHRREWLAKSNKSEGEVGPVRGFRMEYLIERQVLGPLEQLRVGNGVMRLSLSRWTIHPDETLAAENFEQASASQSRFLMTVRSVSPDTTCTFWVYPESFATYQKLKQLVHKNGLRVAGRPLPEGIPISGSPQGSRSAAQ